jgi:hypothetical protein
MRSSKAAARAGIVLGALAVLAIPIGILAAQQSPGLRLLQTLYVVVPIAGVLAVLALMASRHARFRLARSLHPERRSLVRWARIMAWAGIYAAFTGGLALAVYGVLHWAQT